MLKCLNNYLQTGDSENLKDVYRLASWHLCNLKWSDILKNILHFVLVILLISFLLLNVLVIASVSYETNKKGTSYIEEFKSHLIILSNLEANEK